MSQKLSIDADTVHVIFSDDPVDHVDKCEIVADYDLEGNPVGFEAFDFKSPPLGKVSRLDTADIKASFSAEDNTLSVWFKKDPHSGDQEPLSAQFEFSKDGALISVKYKYQRGAAAQNHKNASRHI